MFADLDDPLPFVPGPELLDRIHQEGRRGRRRRRGQRALAGAAIVLVVAVAGAALFVARRDAAIDRVDVATAPSTDGAVNVLLLGVDRLADPVAADTIVVLRFRPDGSVGLLSLPRDLAYPADGDAHARLNLAITGGVQSMVDAVVGLTGVPVDHVVELDFAGFEEIVDELGGLRIGVVQRLRDDHLGLDVGPTACATLGGEDALALVRSRWTQVQDAAGRWIPDPTGDLGRIARAQAIATAVVTQLAALDPSVTDLDRISRVLADHAVLDEGLTLRRLVDLGLRLQAAGPAGTHVDDLPTEGFQAEGGAQMLRIVGHPSVLADYGAPGATDPAAPDEPSAGPVGPQLVPCRG